MAVIALRILLNKYGKEFTRVLKRDIKTNRLYASGDTYESVRYRVHNTELTISYDKALKIQDEGIKKNYMPSSTKILQWMKDKNIRPRATSRGSNQFAGGGQDDRNIKASAFAIARSIGRKGTIKRFGYKGSNIITDTLSPSSKVGKEFQKELKENFNEKINNVFFHQQQ